MSEVEQQVQTVNIKIRSMHGQFSSHGIWLEDGGDYACPKLKPGEVVSVATDHLIFDSPAMEHIEITRQEATRPYRYDSYAEAKMGSGMTPDEAIRATESVANSLDMSAQIRQENLEAIARAKEEGTYRPQPQINYAAQDRKEGLGNVRADNSELRDGGSTPNPVATSAAPPSRRRGR